MNKSDLLNKIKLLLIRMKDHETPENVTNKEELGPLLKDSEDLLETVSILKYLIEEEEEEVLKQTQSTEPTAIPKDHIDAETEIQEPVAVEAEQASANSTVDTEVSEPSVIPTQQDAVSEDENVNATINEIISPSNENTSVADTLEKGGVSDLHAAIGINERFLFINELFDGDDEAYKSAINQLNDFLHLPEALKYVRAELSDRYTWDQEQESTISFYSLIEKRYAE